MIFVWIAAGAFALLLVVVVIISVSRSRREQPDTSYQDALKALLDGRETTALRLLRDTVMKDTDNIDAYIRLGRLVRQRGDAERAAHIHQSLTVRPALKRSEELLIYEELVEDYLAMGRFEKSIGLLKELLRLARTKLPHLRRLLSMLLVRKRTDEAAEVLQGHEKLLEDKNEAAAWYAELARRYWEAGQDAEAAEALKRANRLAKNHPYALMVQIEHLAAVNQGGKARSLVDRFFTLYPQHAEKMLDTVERLYFELGIYEKVAPLYESLLKRHPEKRELRLRLAGLKAKEGASKQALALIEEALAECPDDVGFLLERTRLLLEQGDINEVRETVERLAGILALAPLICAACGSELAPGAWFCPVCGEPVSEL